MLLILVCIGLVVMYDKDLSADADSTAKSPNRLKENLSEPWMGKIAAEQEIWYAKGLEELQQALDVDRNRRQAKNIILFVGDGMGPNTVTASRITKYGEGGQMVWERFPHMGMIKTYSVDKQVPDSASTGTALFGGVKVNYHTIGVDSSVPEKDCAASLNRTHHIDTILQWAQDAGMKTGFVTTTRVVHATPAGLYANVPDRSWECENRIPQADRDRGCKDIARQLIEDAPGKNINVIMGGGRQCLVSNVTGTADDPISDWSCYSTDGRNLIHDWQMDKNVRNLRGAVVQNNGELDHLNPTNVDYVLGIFANEHLSYEDRRNTAPQGSPSLKQMVDKAIGVLAKNRSRGFLLVVEGGMIDMAHHRGWAKRAISETMALDDAVASTLKLMESQLDETLIIVTADHSHTLSINGYPAKGNSIFGVAQKSKSDQIPYTTLTYGTGHFGYQVENVNGKLQRHDPSNDNLNDYEYVQQVAIYTDENVHGGNDVTIYAQGPWAHLFHKIHEQSYVAHAISFAARIGQFRDKKWYETIIDSPIEEV